MSDAPRPLTAAAVASPAGLSRRQALGALAAHMAMALAGCSKPDQTIVPYVRAPDRGLPGEPLRFATGLPLAGYGRGVVVTSVDGRPIKIEGNPHHPASLGSTDVFAEADVLSLYDPDRSRTIAQKTQIASWEALQGAVLPQIERLRQSKQAGLRLLTGRVTSPTLLRQIREVLEAFPNARWHVHEPTENAAEQAGATLAFAQVICVRPRLQDADVLVLLDADPIGPGPDQIRNARAFTSRRSQQADTMSRVYAFECAGTLSGAKADHRLALSPALIFDVALAIANGLGAALPARDLPADAARMVQAASADLLNHRGRSLLIAGRTLPPEGHALVHWVNAHLEAPLDAIEPPDRPVGQEPASLEALVRDLNDGMVRILLIAGTNPVYTAPTKLAFAQAAARAPLVLHAGLYSDETATAATWHIPLSHPLESWSDIRATDGTATIIQPLIRPLYHTRTIHELVAALFANSDASAYELVRTTWSGSRQNDFEEWWTQALENGLVPDTAAKPIVLPPPKLPSINPRAPSADRSADQIGLVFLPDSCVWDGSYSNNAWLQELPKPLTKQVWGNALSLHQSDADRLQLTRGDIVRVRSQDATIEAAVDVETAHAPGVASLSLGYGRTRAGAIGNGIGSNAYALLPPEMGWVLETVTLEKTGAHRELLVAQHVVRAGSDLPASEIERRFPLLSPAILADQGNAQQQSEKLPSLMPDWPRPQADHAWAMVIDNLACIGCNACVVACQAENNVPVVGPEEIARGREMHWLRIDVYQQAPARQSRAGFQLVPCMHCEHAPCEPVCPVAASVHDGEGLNVQVYNRCIGTRFCQANCPYKVRRFNFFGYADGQEYANLGLDPYRAQRNPEVTVRARGVMEKCTYCTQRISAARRASEREHRPIAADEVTTACQDACPTRAITFGDLMQPESQVSQRKRDPRHYVLLGELNTRPRTTYLADMRNPSSAVGEGS